MNHATPAAALLKQALEPDIHTTPDDSTLTTSGNTVIIALTPTAAERLATRLGMNAALLPLDLPAAGVPCLIGAVTPELTRLHLTPDAAQRLAQMLTR